ncbi:transposase domain-containing protein [Embleya sp. NBC_00896]|uniref:transposase domain-containing protein n=1 Tax=Embleya sp. NBC_00896 TaxID=2975961 RepID=UPI002F91493A
MKSSTGERFSDRIALGVLTRAFPPELINEVVAGCGRGEQRRRLLPARVVVYFVLAMCLFGSGQRGGRAPAHAAPGVGTPLGGGVAGAPDGGDRPGATGPPRFARPCARGRTTRLPRSRPDVLRQHPEDRPPLRQRPSGVSPSRLALAITFGLREILERPLPPRRARSNPRVIKRKMSNWAFKRAEPRHPPRPNPPTSPRSHPPSRHRTSEARPKSPVLPLGSRTHWDPSTVQARTGWGSMGGSAVGGSVCVSGGRPRCLAAQDKGPAARPNSGL